MIYYTDIKLYENYYFIDNNNNFPSLLNINPNYKQLENHKTYNELDTYINIDVAFNLIQQYTNNYQHWMLELLPKLSDYKNDIPILVSSDIIQPFKDLLNDLNIHNIYYIEHNKIYLINKLYVSDKININFDNKKLIYTDIYNTIINTYKTNNNSLTSEKIYISRKDSNIRKLKNEDIVENYFSSIGFKIVLLSKLNFQEKVKLFMNSKIILGFIGAGMINIIFSRFGNKVILLLHPKFKCIYYWNILKRQFNINLNLVDGICYTDSNEKIDNLEYTANMNLLISKLNTILSNSV